MLYTLWIEKRGGRIVSYSGMGQQGLTREALTHAADIARSNGLTCWAGAWVR